MTDQSAAIETVKTAIAATSDPEMNRDLRNTLIMVVYEGFAFLPGYVRWAPGGNSVKQNEARDFARRAIATRDTGSAPAEPAADRDGGGGE